MATSKKAPGTAVATAKAQLPMNLQEQLAAEAAALQKQIASGGGDMIKSNKDRTFTLPDGTVVPSPMDVIVVDFAYANSFYTAAYNPNNPQPAVCYAVATAEGTLVPADVSPERQADSCAECPNNVFGSGVGQGKACSNNVLLAVLPPDFDDQTPLSVIKVQTTAIRYWNAYVKTAGRVYQRPPYGLITQLSIAEGTDYQSLRFGEPRVLDNDQLTRVLGRRDEARTRLLTVPDMTPRDVVRKPIKGPAKAVAGRR